MSKNDIELPPMPEWAAYQNVENAVHAYAIAAIKADRQRRCEPVAWHTEDHLTDKSATTYDPVVAKRWIEKGWPVTPLFYAPQQPSTKCPGAGCPAHYATPQPTKPDEERLAMEAVMESVDPATWSGLTIAQRCALGRFAKPQPSAPTQGMNKELSQFLSDVMTAAGLVSHGKQCKELGERLRKGCINLRNNLAIPEQVQIKKEMK